MFRTIFVFIVAFLWSNFIFSATWYINDNSLTGDVYCSAVGSNANPGTAALPKLTLTAVIASASSGDVIYIDAGTYTDKQINFRSSSGTSVFTIYGAGNDLTIFDGTGDSKEFEASTYDWEITISNLRIYNYYASTGGAAFDVTANRKLILNNVVITNSRNRQPLTLSVGTSTTSELTISGGGLFCNAAGAIIVSGGFLGSGILNLSNVAFINNSGLSYGSAIYIGEGSGFADSTPDNYTRLKKCIISNCHFEGNSGTNTSTIYIYNKCSSGCGIDNVDYLIENCTFKNNSTTTGGASYGGTVSLRMDNNAWLINHCLFETNTNRASYGTVAIHTGNVDLTRIKFTGNTTTSSEGKDLYAHLASAAQEATPYFLNDPVVDVTNCFFLSSSENVSRNSSAAVINLITSGTPTNTGDYTGDGLSQTYSWVAISGSDWSGSCGGGIVLPIELLSFEARKSENFNLITWKTAAEIENDFFTVFKSYDGHNFEVLGYVKGAGNTTIENSYSLVDRDRVDGIVYYQLKQTNYNGESQFSDLISIDNSLNTKAHLIKITNLIGQEVSENESGILIYHFSDGSNLKRFHH